MEDRWSIIVKKLNTYQYLLHSTQDDKAEDFLEHFTKEDVKIEDDVNDNHQFLTPSEYYIIIKGKQYNFNLYPKLILCNPNENEFFNYVEKKTFNNSFDDYLELTFNSKVKKINYYNTFISSIKRTDQTKIENFFDEYLIISSIENKEFVKNLLNIFNRRNNKSYQVVNLPNGLISINNKHLFNDTEVRPGNVVDKPGAYDEKDYLKTPVDSISLNNLLEVKQLLPFKDSLNQILVLNYLLCSYIFNSEPHKNIVKKENVDNYINSRLYFAILKDSTNKNLHPFFSILAKQMVEGESTKDLSFVNFSKNLIKKITNPLLFLKDFELSKYLKINQKKIADQIQKGNYQTAANSLNDILDNQPELIDLIEILANETLNQMNYNKTFLINSDPDSLFILFQQFTSEDIIPESNIANAVLMNELKSNRNADINVPFITTTSKIFEGQIFAQENEMFKKLNLSSFQNIIKEMKNKQFDKTFPSIWANEIIHQTALLDSISINDLLSTFIYAKKINSVLGKDGNFTNYNNSGVFVPGREIIKYESNALKKTGFNSALEWLNAKTLANIKSTDNDSVFGVDENSIAEVYHQNSSEYTLTPTDSLYNLILSRQIQNTNGNQGIKPNQIDSIIKDENFDIVLHKIIVDALHSDSLNNFSSAKNNIQRLTSAIILSELIAEKTKIKYPDFANRNLFDQRMIVDSVYKESFLSKELLEKIKAYSAYLGNNIYAIIADSIQNQKTDFNIYELINTIKSTVQKNNKISIYETSLSKYPIEVIFRKKFLDPIEKIDLTKTLEPFETFLEATTRDSIIHAKYLLLKKNITETYPLLTEKNVAQLFNLNPDQGIAYTLKYVPERTINKINGKNQLDSTYTLFSIQIDGTISKVIDTISFHFNDTIDYDITFNSEIGRNGLQTNNFLIKEHTKFIPDFGLKSIGKNISNQRIQYEKSSIVENWNMNLNAPMYTINDSTVFKSYLIERKNRLVPFVFGECKKRKLIDSIKFVPNTDKFIKEITTHFYYFDKPKLIDIPMQDSLYVFNDPTVGFWKFGKRFNDKFQFRYTSVAGIAIAVTGNIYCMKKAISQYQEYLRTIDPEIARKTRNRVGYAVAGSVASSLIGTALIFDSQTKYIFVQKFEKDSNQQFNVIFKF